MTKRTRDPATQGTGGVTAGAALQAFPDAGAAAGGVLHDSYGLGSALIVAIVIAALGALTLLSRGGRTSALPGRFASIWLRGAGRRRRCHTAQSMKQRKGYEEHSELPFAAQPGPLQEGELTCPARL
jgi:hypothetical protein